MKPIENNGNTCDNCKFFRAYTKRPQKGMDVRYGECRRFPPTRDETKDEPTKPIGWHWPEVYGEQWCGEHMQGEVVN